MMKQRETVCTLRSKVTFTKSIDWGFGFIELLFELMLWILLCTLYNTVQIKNILGSFLIGFFGVFRWVDCIFLVHRFSMLHMTPSLFWETNRALLHSYDYYMSRVVVLWRQNQQPTWCRLLVLRFNLLNFHFLVGTTNKLLILWEELQLCRQLKQTTMMRSAREASQVKFFFAVFICCVFFFFRVKQFRDVSTSH